MRQQQDEPGRFSICSRQAAVVHESSPESAVLGIVQRCYMNPECQNLPFNVILRRVLSNIDIIMSIKYLDDEDFRFASGIYYKQLHFDDYFRKLKE
ncbi:hypothetical protein BB078_004680 [Escherichia coli]|nr:hypothetical protein [Escherichia coli]